MDPRLVTRNARVPTPTGHLAGIHQHVSYPHDPDTGEAKTDLRP